MKILLVSDSHTIYDELAQLFAYYRGKVEAIVHCGDSELMHADEIWKEVDLCVRGNMDFNTPFVTEAVLKTDVHRIYVAHGHLQQVNFSRERLADKAKQHQCKVAFYGHTHVLRAENVMGVICINPGSLNHSRGPIQERTYAIVDLAKEHVSVTYYKYNHEVVDTQIITYH